MTKMYSKLVPGVWFDTIPGAEEADEHGMVPAFIHTPDGEGYTVVHLDTVSFVEMTVVPDTIPDTMYVVAEGDPAAPDIELFFTEREAKQAVFARGALRGAPWGYFPVHVERNSMIPV